MKRLIWLGKSYEDLKEFPPEVRHAMGYALYAAQIGKMHERAKVLSGMGSAKVIEIRENDRSGTYRVIYTIEMKDFFSFCMHFKRNQNQELRLQNKSLTCSKIV